MQVPTKYETVINLKTAKVLDLDLPPAPPSEAIGWPLASSTTKHALRSTARHRLGNLRDSEGFIENTIRSPPSLPILLQIIHKRTARGVWVGWDCLERVLLSKYPSRPLSHSQ